MTRAAALYFLGLSCVGLGLAIAWIQSGNHALADELQRTERASLDLEVRIEAADNACVVEIHRALAGLPHADREGVDLEAMQ